LFFVQLPSSGAVSMEIVLPNNQSAKLSAADLFTVIVLLGRVFVLHAVPAGANQSDTEAGVFLDRAVLARSARCSDMNGRKTAGVDLGVPSKQKEQ
jgi:hypothetical protein